MIGQRLFTFIMDWNEGTYISQSYGINVTKATEYWVKHLDCHILETSDCKLELFTNNILEELTPIPIKENQSVWCISEFLEDKLAIVNIVETQESEL